MSNIHFYIDEIKAHFLFLEDFEKNIRISKQSCSFNSIFNNL